MCEIRSTFEELKTKYMLESEIIDVYVEGAEDKRFYSHHIGSDFLVTGPFFLDISNVDFEGENLDAFSLETNNRDKIIYMIGVFQESRIGSNVFGIIDKDILPYTRTVPKYSNLLVTDFSCLEMYCLCPRNISKVHDLFFKSVSTQLIQSIMEALLPLTAFCIYEKRKNLSIKKIQLKNYIGKDSFSFDWKSYIRSALTTGGLSATVDTAISDVELILSNELKDKEIKDCTNGHVFFEALSNVLKRLEKKNHCCVESIFFASVETEFLLKFPLFNRLNSMIPRTDAYI